MNGSGSMSFASSSSAVVVAQKKSAFSSSSSSSRQMMMKLTQRRRQRQRRRGDENNNNNNFLLRAMAIQEGGEVKTTYVTLPDEKVLVAHAKTAVNSGIHTVALECKPSLPKGLILHWGVIRGGGEKVRQVKGRLVKVVRRFMRPAESYPTRPPVPPSPRPVTGVSIPC